MTEAKRNATRAATVVGDEQIVVMLGQVLAASDQAKLTEPARALEPPDLVFDRAQELHEQRFGAGQAEQVDVGAMIELQLLQHGRRHVVGQPIERRPFAPIVAEAFIDTPLQPAARRVACVGTLQELPGSEQRQPGCMVFFANAGAAQSATANTPPAAGARAAAMDDGELRRVQPAKCAVAALADEGIRAVLRA